MNKITWMITIPLVSRMTGKFSGMCCPSSRLRKSSRGETNTENPNAYGMPATEMTGTSSDATQRNPWDDEDQRLMAEIRPPAAIKPSTNTPSKFQASDSNPTCSTLTPVPYGYGVHISTDDWPIASPSEIIDVPSSDNSSRNSQHQEIVDSQKRIIPVRKAPAPPGQMPVQRGAEILSPSELLMTSEAGSVVAQTPETLLPVSHGSFIPATTQPVVPPRPDFTVSPRPVVAPRPEANSPHRPGPIIPQRPQPLMP